MPRKKFEYVVENVVTEMLDVPFEWAKIVPITVEISVGVDWMKMEEIGKFLVGQSGFSGRNLCRGKGMANAAS